MGYYTEYSLTVDYSQSKDEDEKKKQSEIEEIQQSSISDELKKRLIKDVENTYQNSVITQNDVIEDMLRVSKKYPNVIFSLYGNGEENGDMWVEYFMNGKVQTERAVITYADFDPEKLN
jgi:hypothetical protein